MKDIKFGSSTKEVTLHPISSNKIKNIYDMGQTALFSTYSNLILERGSNYVNTIDGAMGCLYCNVPELIFSDLSVFVVLMKLKYEQTSNNYEHILNNNDGYCDKISNFESGVPEKLKVDGSLPRSKVTFSIPLSYRLNGKIFVSCHWFPLWSC